jgi:hypothetical protein
MSNSPDKGVNGHGTLLAHKNRIDFNFFKAGVCGHQSAKLHGKIRQSGHIGLGAAPVAIQQRPKPQTAQRV